MKTSFFFCLWMLIYPLLALLDSELVNEYSFFFALLVVFLLSRFVANRMPHILAYERISEMSRVMEPAYEGDVRKFRKELGSRMLIDGIWAIYVIITVISLVFAMLDGAGNQLFTLVIFALLGMAAIRSSVKFTSAYSALSRNPTPEQCVEIVQTAYGYDYASYYEAHQGQTAAQMLPPIPRRYKGYLIFSIVVAAVCALLGTLSLALAIFVTVANSMPFTFVFMSGYFLYASVAIYFGIKDLAGSIASLKSLGRVKA